MDPTKFTISSAKKAQQDEEHSKDREKEAQDNLRKDKRADETRRKAAEKKMEKAMEDKKKDDAARNEGVLRGKINAYFKSKLFGPLLDENIEHPRTSDKLPQLEEKLKEIHDFMNKLQGHRRLLSALALACTYGEHNWPRMPEVIKCNLTGISTEYWPLIEQSFDPLLEEIIINYPGVCYAPLFMRFGEAVFSCCKAIDALNIAKLGPTPIAASTTDITGETDMPVYEDNKPPVV